MGHIKESSPIEMVVGSGLNDTRISGGASVSGKESEEEERERKRREKNLECFSRVLKPEYIYSFRFFKINFIFVF